MLKTSPRWFGKLDCSRSRIESVLITLCKKLQQVETLDIIKSGLNLVDMNLLASD